MDPLTIIAAISAASALVNTLAPIIADRKRKKELTPEEEAAWDEYVAKQQAAPHWRPSTAQTDDLPPS